MENKYDLIIIGGGPGGADAAEEAVRQGMDVALIERDLMGGTCLNRGCIPTKTLLHTADLYRDMKNAIDEGRISGNDVKVDLSGLQAYKEDVIGQLRAGQTGALEKAGVDIFNGMGTILGDKRVKVGSDILEGDNILIATGSRPSRIPVEGGDLPGVITSDELLSLTRVPESLIIVGGGVIGMEFAQVFSSLGSQVTVVETLKRVLFNFDKEISRSLTMVMGKRGVDINTETKLLSIEKTRDGKLRCSCEKKGEGFRAEGDLVLMATGRSPVTDGLFDDADLESSLKTEKGYIKTDENSQTAVEGIYAVGDVTGGMQLAHTASARGRIAVCHMAGRPAPLDPANVPACVYTDPEIASVGSSADAAKEAGIKAVSKKYPMSANGKSVLTGQERGFVKIIVKEDTGQILGAQMMCARATDMISQFSQAISNGLTVDKMSNFIYPHPTFSEGIGKAAEI